VLNNDLIPQASEGDELLLKQHASQGAPLNVDRGFRISYVTVFIISAAVLIYTLVSLSFSEVDCNDNERLCYRDNYSGVNGLLLDNFLKGFVGILGIANLSSLFIHR